jgi:hypothetical protein
MAEKELELVVTSQSGKDVSYEGSRALGAHTYIPSLDVHINWVWDKSSEQHEH